MPDERKTPPVENEQQGEEALQAGPGARNTRDKTCHDGRGQRGDEALDGHALGSFVGGVRGSSATRQKDGAGGT
jgi:hypothetical protein